MAKLFYSSTRDADMRYLASADVSDAFFLVEKDGKRFVYLDRRELEAFREKNREDNIESLPLEPLMEQAVALEGDSAVHCKIALAILANHRLTDESVEVPISFPLDLADYLRSHGITLSPKADINAQRAVKSLQEKLIIKDNLKRTQKAYARIEEILSVSVIKKDEIFFEGDILTSEVLKLECERVLLDLGMLDTEGMIISCASQSAIPHHRGHGPIRPHQTIICDLFPRNRENGYYADMTRTYVKGQPSETIIRMFDAVAKAQQAALDMVAGGTRCADVQDRVERIFMDEGFDVGEKGFVHGTGHGLGLDIHESPYINRLSGNSVFQVGNVVTVEPGLYYPEVGGVRIEDVVYVAEKGCDNLTDYPKNLIIT